MQLLDRLSLLPAGLALIVLCFLSFFIEVQATAYDVDEGIYTTSDIYVHEKQSVTIDGSLYPESRHNYAANSDEEKVFTWSGADSLVLTFSSDSETESGWDFVYLYDGAGNEIGKYSGSTLANLEVTIPGDSFVIRLTSDGSGHKFGYSFSSIVAESILHTYEQGECSICGLAQYPIAVLKNGRCITGGENLSALLENYAPGQYIKLFTDIQADFTINSDLYIDLNGYSMTGTIVTNEYHIYGMDSTTNTYSCMKMGYFSCADKNGEAIEPVPNFKTDAQMTVDIRRYMAIETEKGYTFHRFYLGIINTTLNTATTGVGYKAEFYGDDMVKAQLDTFGFTMQLDGFNTITCYKAAEDFVSGKTVTVRINNYDAANYGETALYASVCMQLSDGTFIQSAEHTVTMRGLIESVNSNLTSYSADQLAAVKTMIVNNPAMQAWKVGNIYKEAA